MNTRARGGTLATEVLRRRLRFVLGSAKCETRCDGLMEILSDALDKIDANADLISSMERHGARLEANRQELGAALDLLLGEAALKHVPGQSGLRIVSITAVASARAVRDRLQQA